MYEIYPWWTALYFTMTCFVGWVLMWSGLWVTSVVVQWSVKALKG